MFVVKNCLSDLKNYLSGLKNIFSGGEILFSGPTMLHLLGKYCFWSACLDRAMHSLCYVTLCYVMVACVVLY